MKRYVCAILTVLCVICAFSSCGGKTTGELFAMDTYMTFTVYGSGNGALLSEAEKTVKRLDENFSVSSVTGEIGRLIKDGCITEPSAELLQMLSVAKTLYERSGGLYDVSAYSLSELWRICEREGRVPSAQEIEQAKTLVGMDRLVFDEEKVSLNGLGGIDLGSVVKGYAGDKVKALYKEQGASGLLDLGGNIVTVGTKENGEPFKIGVTDPLSPDKLCGYLLVSETNVVTSGKYNRNFTVDGVRYHHIIDVKSGRPCENGVASVTVICTDGMLADALSTMLFLMGEDGALEYYRQYGGFEAVIVTDDGRIVTTDGAKDIFSAANGGA